MKGKLFVLPRRGEERRGEERRKKKQQKQASYIG